MSQAHKKSSPQAAAKMAAGQAQKIASQAFAASDEGRKSAENVVRIGSAAMQDFFANSSGEAKKAQEKAMAFTRESAQKFAESSDAMSKFMNEVLAMSRGNVETAVECGNLTASMAKDISSEAFESANQAFAESIEMSREFFACRTFSDMFDLQNRMGRSMMDNFFKQSSKFSDKFFEYSTEALEPINERVSQASEQFSKAFAD